MGGRGGLAVATGYVAVIGVYCLLTALLGFTEAGVPGSALSWYRTSTEAAVYLVILAAGYAPGMGGRGAHRPPGAAIGTPGAQDRGGGAHRAPGPDHRRRGRMLRPVRLPRHHDGRHRRGGRGVQGNPVPVFPR